MLRFGFISFGQGGSKLIEAFAMFKNSTKHKDGYYPVLAVNTTDKDIDPQSFITGDNQYILRVNGKALGAGKVPDDGQAAFIANVNNLREIMQSKFKRVCDQVFLVAGLGGGTGTGCLPSAIQVALELELPVSIICTLPQASEDFQTKQNAAHGFAQIANMAAEYNIPMIVIDNDRISKMTSTGITKSMRDLNMDFAKILDGFNSSANKPSTDLTFDQKDYLRMFDIGGGMAFSVLSIPVEECEIADNIFDIQDTKLAMELIETWENDQFCHVNFQSAMQAAVIIEVPIDVLSKSRKFFESFLHQLETLVKNTNVFKALYPAKSDSNTITIRTLLSGMPVAIERVKQIYSESQAGEEKYQKKYDNLLTSMQVDIETTKPASRIPRGRQKASDSRLGASTLNTNKKTTNINDAIFGFGK